MFFVFYFHLCDNTFVTPQQAEKMFKNKNGIILVRDAAQAIWGIEKLSQWSVRAKLAPGKATEEDGGKQLTPAKVEAVYGEYFCTELIAVLHVIFMLFFFSLPRALRAHPQWGYQGACCRGATHPEW